MNEKQALDAVRVVLVRPTHPGNIGAVARAMGNMGLSDLALVAPREFPSAVATARASGADAILASARVVADLDQAIASCGFVVGTTARPRSIAWPSLTPRQAAAAIAERAAAAGDKPERVGILFGPERSGLSNADVDRCHALIRIPVDEAMPSLNLASAALVVAYELRLALTPTQESSEPAGRGARMVENRSPATYMTQGRVSPLATADQVHGYYAHLERVLDRIDFLKAKPPVKLMRKIVRIFSRAQLSAEEVNILRGILTTVEHRLDEQPGAGDNNCGDRSQGNI